MPRVEVFTSIKMLAPAPRFGAGWRYSPTPKGNLR
jgi:hypothetical protein